MTPPAVDYRAWDWLPVAAQEIERYLQRLLREATITPHSVTARSKSISSYIKKCAVKNYADATSEMTDIVAVRIITYSNRDRTRAAERIRERFTVKPRAMPDGLTGWEDRNPGEEKEPNLRGYDCQHIVVTGEDCHEEPTWLIAGGELANYFEGYGGLEIQIRTVAAHAWAEFEHARRYKGRQYDALGDHDRETIDQLFGAASDARRALDETFVAIDRLLANPTEAHTTDSAAGGEQNGTRQAVDPSERTDRTPVTFESMSEFLATRFPDDNPSSPAGIEFACNLVEACDFEFIETLRSSLDAIDCAQVRMLMNHSTPVTTVRRLDDELLARFGDSYATRTGSIGRYRSRGEQLEWRYDLLRGKTTYKSYVIDGDKCPDTLRSVRIPGAQAVRELARIVAESEGVSAALVPDAISSENDLDERSRPVEVSLPSGERIWVRSNLNRDYSESLIHELAARTEGITVIKNGVALT